MTKTTDVEIYGQRYSIKGEADETYIRRLAGFVDGQMRQLAEGMNTTTPSRLAVLTALNRRAGAHLAVSMNALAKPGRPLLSWCRGSGICGSRFIDWDEDEVTANR